MIYLARDTEYLKIGLAQPSNLVSRMDTLRVGNPRELEFRLHCETGGRLEEKALHHRFASSRVRGEWFRINDELLQIWESATPLSNREPRGRKPTTRKAAAEWLMNFLSRGPALASEVARAAETAGYRGKTLRRAADAIGVKRPRDGLNPQTIVWAI